MTAFCRCMMAAIMFISFSNTHAQNLGFDIRMPKINKVITVTAENVNLRKSPNATAPLLKNEFIDFEAENGGDHFFWDNGKREGEAVHPYVNNLYLVVDEIPEWYGIICPYNNDKTILAYISKRFTTPVTLESITPKDDPSKIIQNGPYRGYGLEDGISRIVDGVLVTSSKFSGFVSFGDDNTTLKRVRYSKGKTPTVFLGKDIIAEDGAFITYDVNKLTISEFQHIMVLFGVRSGEVSDAGTIRVKHNGQIYPLTSYSLSDPAFKNCETIIYPANKQ